MIKIISYADDFRNYNSKYLIKDNEYIKLNNEVLKNHDALLSFNIRLDNDLKEGWNNPVINFVILESEYNSKKQNIKNYENILFENIRITFKSEVM